MNIWLTSDFHFNHDKEFVWKDRGFSSVYEMNEALIENFNEYVNNDDEVYILGDIIMGRDIEAGINLIKKLNGSKILIYGNHDTDNKLNDFKKERVFSDISIGERFRLHKIPVLLTHYPTLVENFNKLDMINFHGHTHSKNKFSNINGAYHVGVDAHECKPVNLETAYAELKEYINATR